MIREFKKAMPVIGRQILDGVVVGYSGNGRYSVRLRDYSVIEADGAVNNEVGWSVVIGKTGGRWVILSRGLMAGAGVTEVLV